MLLLGFLDGGEKIVQSGPVDDGDDAFCLGDGVADGEVPDEGDAAHEQKRNDGHQFPDPALAAPVGAGDQHRQQGQQQHRAHGDADFLLTQLLGVGADPFANEHHDHGPTRRGNRLEEHPRTLPGAGVDVFHRSLLAGDHLRADEAQGFVFFRVGQVEQRDPRFHVLFDRVRQEAPFLGEDEAVTGFPQLE